MHFFIVLSRFVVCGRIMAKPRTFRPDDDLDQVLNTLKGVSQYVNDALRSKMESEGLIKKSISEHEIALREAEETIQLIGEKAMRQLLQNARDIAVMQKGGKQDA